MVSGARAIVVPAIKEDSVHKAFNQPRCLFRKLEKLKKKKNPVELVEHMVFSEMGKFKRSVSRMACPHCSLPSFGIS